MTKAREQFANDELIGNLFHHRFVTSGLFCLSSPRIVSKKTKNEYLLAINLPFMKDNESYTLDMSFARSKVDNMDDEQFAFTMDHDITQIIEALVEEHNNKEEEKDGE